MPATTAAPQAPVPEACVGPTPRSQMRMRTRSGVSTFDERHVGPIGKRRMVLDGWSQPVELFLGERLDEQDALRVAHRHGHCLDALAAASSSIGRMSCGGPMAARNVIASPRLVLQRQHLPTGGCVDGHFAGAWVSYVRRARPDNAHRFPRPLTRLPSALNSRIRAAVASKAYTIRPSAPMPSCRWQIAGRGVSGPAGDIGFRHQQEVVAVRMAFDDGNAAGSATPHRMPAGASQSARSPIVAGR